MKPLLTAENIFYSVIEKGKKKIILENISFEVEQNSVLGISGESGSGKTTLAKIIGGILNPSAGKINYFFERNHKKVSRIQILFQNTGEIINPLREVGDMIRESVRIGNKNNKYATSLENILDSVKLPAALLQRKGYELSGGEQQRVALARILAVKPELLILDEPFSAQDFESRENFLNLFLDLKKNLSITMMCIAHNLRMLQKLADEIIIMYRGEIVEKSKSKLLLENPQHNYTKFLLKAENYDLKYEEFINLNR